MVAKIRAQRISEQIKADLSQLFITDVTDPRLEGVTVTDVTVDRELAYAKVYVSVLEGSDRKTEVLTGLKSAAGFLRYRLSQQIELRSFPQLRFKWDPTAEKAARIDELIASLEEDKTGDETTEEETPNDG